MKIIKYCIIVIVLYIIECWLLEQDNKDPWKETINRYINRINK